MCTWTLIPQTLYNGGLEDLGSPAFDLALAVAFAARALPACRSFSRVLRFYKAKEQENKLTNEYIIYMQVFLSGFCKESGGFQRLGLQGVRRAQTLLV